MARTDVINTHRGYKAYISILIKKKKIIRCPHCSRKLTNAREIFHWNRYNYLFNLNFSVIDFNYDYLWDHIIIVVCAHHNTRVINIIIIITTERCGKYATYIYMRVSRVYSVFYTVQLSVVRCNIIRSVQFPFRSAVRHSSFLSSLQVLINVLHVIIIIQFFYPPRTSLILLKNIL